jgi:NAD(P)-dependent dehydrogenase (short-subunit alcohol dehydrogenase family)
LDADTLARALSDLAALPPDDPARLRVERAAESLVREGRKHRQRVARAERGAADRAALEATATGAPTRREDAPLDASTTVPIAGTVHKPRRCYVCKDLYTEISGFYHQLCPVCAGENLRWRTARADLAGRSALVTGGRVKIGFQLALMLLRDGASVRVVTRFPHDAVRRFREEPGSGAWLDRLTVTGLDLRDPRQVIELCDLMLDAGDPLDILVNNAAQTVRRPASSYAVLVEAEHRAAAALAAAGTVREVVPITGFRGAAATIGGGPALPPGTAAAGTDADAEALDRFSNAAALAFSNAAALAIGSSAQGISAAEISVLVDEAGLLPDPSPRNSWSAALGDLDPVELLEVQFVNTVAPTLLADRLLPLMLGSPHPRRYIVNVTAVEGRFEVRNKTSRHPHTNMAKAALNMLTRTSAEALAAQRIYMSSVDTGWITDEKPVPSKTRHAAAGFRTPLDIIDGAARVYQPVVSGEAGEPLFGVFLKDYKSVAW